MRRREFFSVLGSAAAWPVVVQAQQPAMPVVGFLHSQGPKSNADRMRAFRQGLKEAGYAEGENVAIEYRWAENQFDRLPALAAELVSRKVAAIVANAPAVFQAKVATTTIPIVFVVAEDPVKLGLVASLARPGGNLTGINFFAAELVAKRLELLRELVPAAARVAVLVNPTGPATVSILRDVEPAGRTIGLQIQVARASTSREIDAAFATLVRERPDALFVGGDPFFSDRRVQIVNTTARHAIPTTFPNRQFAEAGGLISYGPNQTDTFRQLGVHTGRILMGAKPADMPVVQSDKFELVINHQTARMLGLTVPHSLLARADEVIE